MRAFGAFEGPRVWSETIAIADSYRLTVYDATYLELALRLSCRLPPSTATFAKPLAVHEFRHLASKDP
jgi:hypothetical protein